MTSGAADGPAPAFIAPFHPRCEVFSHKNPHPIRMRATLCKILNGGGEPASDPHACHPLQNLERRRRR